MDEEIEIHNQVRFQILLNKYGLPAQQKLFFERCGHITGKKRTDQSKDSKASFIKEFCDLRSCKEDEKAMLLSGDILRWDITLLSFALLNMKISPFSTELYQTKFEEENATVTALKNFRNDIKHREQISAEDSIKLWFQALNILTKFEVTIEEIENIRTASRLDGIEFTTKFTNEENMINSESLRQTGNAAFRSGQISDAIRLYSRALNLTGLSQPERAALHSNRSQAYLQLLEDKKFNSADEINQSAAKALEDATMAVDLRPSLWKGYNLVGKVHRYKREFGKAIPWFEHALSLNPELEAVRKARDESRLALDRANILEYLDPLAIHDSMGTKEVFDYVDHTHGFGVLKDINVMQLMEQNKLFMKSNEPGLMARGCVFMAHRYRNGDGVPLDEKMAASLFKKAADAGNLEGIYNMGLLHLYGRHVPQDAALAIQYFEQAASYPPSGDPLIDTNIAAGIYMIGKCHGDGIGVPQNFRTAAARYRNASAEGCGNASNNLGIFYNEGVGLKNNPKIAMQYWKLAVEQNCPIAMTSIYWGYLDLWDADKAEEWFSRSISSECVPTMLQRKEFKEKLAARRVKIAQFRQDLPEHLHDVPIDSVMRRMANNNFPEVLELQETFRNGRNLYPSTNRSGLNFQVFFECQAEISERCSQGWLYAQNIFHAFTHFKTALENLCEMKGNVALSHEVKQFLQINILEDFAKCYETADFVGSIPDFIAADFTGLIKIGHKMKDERSKRNARICQCYALVDSLVEYAKFVEKSKEMYPEEPFFHLMHTNILGFLNNYKKGSQAAQKGIELFPANYELLYTNAVHLKNGIPDPDAQGGKNLQHNHRAEAGDATVIAEEPNTELVIQAYEEFLQKAPKDHRKVPESHYSIAQMYVVKRDFERAEEFLQRGLKAEECLLSCFLPYHSSAKVYVQSLLQFYLRTQRFTRKVPFTLHNMAEPSASELEQHRKLQATNPKRIFITLKFRNIKFYSSPTYVVTANRTLHVQQALAAALADLRQITFDQMDPTKDHVYEGFVINLMLMEDPVFPTSTSLVHSIVKDENGDFQRIAFCKFSPSDPKIRENLGYGSRIRIQNPYLHLTGDMGLEIRVDDPKSIIYISGSNHNPCRFCWKENSIQICTNCKRARYCSRECQSQDWDLLKHEMICKSKPDFLVGKKLPFLQV